MRQQVIHYPWKNSSMLTRPLTIPVQTLRISHTRTRLHIQTTQYLLDRSLDPVKMSASPHCPHLRKNLLLPIRRNRNLRTLIYDSRHMPRTQRVLNRTLDLLHQLTRQLMTLRHLQKQHNRLI